MEKSLMPPRQDDADGALLVWLHRDLSTRYDAALGEALPAEILDLLTDPP